MKTLFAIILVLLLGGIQSFGQFVDDSTYHSWWKNKASSIFENTNTGTYYGNAHGYIHIENSKAQELVLDFQFSKAKLNIIEDEYQVYDNSTKVYSAKTTSGRTELGYKTYALANILLITLNNEEYSYGVIDGACDMPLDGLSFNYCSESDIEYLTLFITKPLVLSNSRGIMREENVKYSIAKKKSQEITVLPGSTMIFTIEK